jgi:hypothetical protein
VTVQELLHDMEVGCALTVPSRLWLDEDSGEERVAVTLCKARRGVRHRIERKVLVDCPVSLVRIRVREAKIPVIARPIRMGGRDYFIDIISPAPSESEPLDLLCRQKRMVFLVYDQEDQSEPVRKIVTANEPQDWAHIRAAAHRLAPTSHEDFVAAATRFLADPPDLPELWRVIKRGTDSFQRTAVTFEGLPPGQGQRTLNTLVFKGKTDLLPSSDDVFSWLFVQKPLDFKRFDVRWPWTGSEADRPEAAMR